MLNHLFKAFVKPFLYLFAKRFSLFFFGLPTAFLYPFVNRVKKMPLDSTHVGATNHLSPVSRLQIKCNSHCHWTVRETIRNVISGSLKTGLASDGKMAGVFRGIANDLLTLADFCGRNSPLDYNYIYKRVLELREDVANAANNCVCTINGRIIYNK